MYISPKPSKEAHTASSNSELKNISPIRLLPLWIPSQSKDLLFVAIVEDF